MSQPKNNGTERRQTAYLPVILWILPLLAINIGLAFFSQIDIYWQKHEQEIEARQEVEALAAGANFSYQYAKQAGEFMAAFKSGVEAEFTGAKIIDYLKNRADLVFRKPFPDYELFTFKLPANGTAGNILYMKSSTPPSRRALARTFEHLIKINKGGDSAEAANRPNERLLCSLIGQESKSEVTARSQKGKASFILYKSLPARFLWNYFETGNGDKYGFYLISHHSEGHDNAGRLLALRDLRSHCNGYGAFVPVFSGFGGTVYQSPLHKSNTFRRWAKEEVVSADKNLKKWLESGGPDVATLGQYLAFSHIGKSQTHLAVYLTPQITTPDRPTWLFLLNLGGISLIILMILRGLLLSQWPEFNLRLRFILTYLLSATLPLSLLIISAYGYVTQYRRATYFETFNSLQLSIKQFDTRKAQVEDEYRAAFNSVFRDEEVGRLLATHGSESTAARDRILEHFESSTQKLPLLCFAIIDENGHGVRYYGGHTESEADPTIDTFEYPIVLMLRNKIKKYYPDVEFEKLKVTSIQQTSLEAYASLTSDDLVSELDKRRSFPIKRQIGARTATQMHDLISIDGREKFALFVVWDDQALDKVIFKNSLSQIALNSPDHNFIAFRAAPQGLEFLIDPDRHINGNFVSKAKELANLALFRGSYATKQYENLSLVAMPAKRYDQIIIVGGIQHFDLNQAIEYRLLIFLAILAFSLVVVILSSYFAAKLILDPIETLKKALDRVASGQLTTEIVSHSEDELGTLCREFSTMTIGLRERKRLGTLLSDQAMDAIAKTSTGQRQLNNESFAGVALVSDIRNFTGLCEKHEPGKVTELLNEHFAGMASIISSHGGRIYKFIGDAIEAVFPENPDLPDDAAARAFNAASLMLIKAKQINQMRLRRKQFDYRIGIGLAYGNMHSGSIGSIDTRLDYAIIGEPLKLAARLEALSVQNQAFPMVIDEHLCNALSGRGMVFTEIGNTEGKPGFSLNELGSEYKALTSIELKGTSSNGENLEDGVKKFVVGAGEAQSPYRTFIPGVALLVAVVCGIIFAAHFRQNSVLMREKSNAASENQRTLEQLRSDNAELVGFEANCRHLLAELESQMTANPDFTKEQVNNFLKPKVGTIIGNDIVASRMAVYYIEPTQDTATHSYQGHPVFVEGWNREQSALLLDQATTSRQLFDSFFELQMVKDLLEEQKPYFRDVFGDQITGAVLHREILSKAVEFSRNGTKEFFFWDYIVAGGDSDRNSAFSRCKDARIVGYFLAAAPADKLKHSATHLVNSYKSERQQLALVSETGSATYSAGFPSGLRQQIKYSEPLPFCANAVINDIHLQLGTEPYRLVVCNAVDSKSAFANAPLLLTAFILSGILLIFWWKTSLGETFVNRSLAAKLWLTLLLASIVPIITVFFVFGLFTDEDYSVGIAKEKTELHRFIDLFELRESFADPLAWKMVRNWSKQPYTQDLANQLNSESRKNGQISSASIALISDMFKSWFTEYETLDQKIINFSPKDIVIAGDGWSFASSGKDSMKPSEFGVMLQGVANNMANNRISQKIKTGLDSNAVQSEIIVETGLQTVRSLFGDDVFVRMAHSVEVPVLMNVINGTAGLITHMIPNIKSPNYLILWMMVFDYEDYLARLAISDVGRYSIFTALSHRHGNMLSPYMAGNRHELGLLGAWITSANLPLSKRIELAGEHFLVEGRPGVAQLASFLIATAPEAPIKADIARKKLYFALALLFSLLLILVIARNAAADVLNPIESLINGMKFASCENYNYRINMTRGDELGDLCNSFDSMMRGLEEKNLMGHMLSKSALSYSNKNQTESSTGEFVFLYIGIPSFSSWIAGSPVEQMFIDLKEQITQISGIVMTEGGDIDKIIGDKVLAVFAVDGNLPEAVSSACHAAIKIIAAESKANLPFPVAIGINSGKVITGLLGVGEKRDFTVIGDAVNVAARIESLAEILRYQRCLISPNVFAALKPDLSAREYGEVELKGKALPLKVYQLSI
ncbi:MAG: HAMP domain-containing protein [Candidatus Riflebacteria bacterium]|nr:HAMP domain-containing protein [Candidatus Riflebacteria bacterium]